MNHIAASQRRIQLVDGEGRVEWNLRLDAGLRILVEELHAGAARIEHEDRLGLGVLRLGEFGGEVELARPHRVFLADHLALEGALEARQHVLAGGVVRADQEHRLDALLVHVEAHRLRRLVVLPGGREHVRRAQFAGELRGSGVRRDQEGFGIDRGLQRGQQHVRPDIAGDEIDLVGLDQLFGLLLADIRLLPVILVDHLDRLAAHLAAHMIQRQLERVAHVVADHSGRAAEGRDKADLDGVAGGCGLRQRQNCCACQPECLFHNHSPPRYRTKPGQPGDHACPARLIIR